MLSLLVSVPAMFAASEFDKFEREDKIAAAKKEQKDAQKAYDDKDATIKDKWTAYTNARDAYNGNITAVEDANKVVAELTKQLNDLKKDATKNDTAIKDIEDKDENKPGTMAKAQKTLNDLTAKTSGLNTEKANKEKEARDAGIYALGHAKEVADAKVAFLTKELELFNAKAELATLEAELKAIKEPTAEEKAANTKAEGEKTTADAKVTQCEQAVKTAQAADANLLKDSNSQQAKDLLAAQAALKDAQDKAAAAKTAFDKANKPLADYNGKGAKETRVAQLQKDIFGDKFAALDKAKNELKKKQDAKATDTKKEEDEVKGAQKAYDEATDGFEKQAKQLEAAYNKLNPQGNFIYRFFRGTINTSISAAKSVYRAWGPTGVDSKVVYAKTALNYNSAPTAPVADKLLAFKKALRTQGIDYGKSASTIKQSLGLGAIASAVATGLAYKFVDGRFLGNRLYETAAAGAATGLLTTGLSALYLAWHNGVFSYGERRQHIIDTAKLDKITKADAENFYNNICPTRWQACRRFGFGALHMKHIANALPATY